MNVPFHWEIFIARQVTDIRPYSVTDKLRGRYHSWHRTNISQPSMVLYIPLKLSVTEDGLTAKTSLTIPIFHWNWRIINPSSHHYVLPLYERKENNFLPTIKGNWPYQSLPNLIIKQEIIYFNLCDQLKHPRFAKEYKFVIISLLVVGL